MPAISLFTLLCSLVGLHALAVAPPLTKVATPTYPLHDEAASGDANAVDLLLMSGLSGDERNAFGSTPLHLAAVKGHANVATVLLQHGSDVNARNEDGNTPLHAAVGSGQHEVVRTLLENGATADVTSDSGKQPLQVACQRGDGKMVSDLIRAGAELDEDSVQMAFWAAVQLVEAKPEGAPLSADVPRLLRHVFDADIRQLIGRGKATTNVTCMQPLVDGTGYDIINDDLAQLPLKEGRTCEGGVCCDECSRVRACNAHEQLKGSRLPLP